jgi:predicted nucleic acid-binding protein
MKRYAVEAGSAAIQQLIEGSDGLSCSAIGIVEAAAAIARRSRNTATPALAGALGQLEKDWSVFLQVRISDAVLKRSRTFAVTLGLRAADAIHLASAASLAAKLPPRYRRLVVAVSDQELLAAADQLGLKVWNPEDQV